MQMHRMKAMCAKMTLLVSSLDAAAARLLDEVLAGNVSRLTILGLVDYCFLAPRLVGASGHRVTIAIHLGLSREAVHPLY
ncbi:hypothetical protein BST63_07695 [Bradyrhizobium canariense]|uniref:Uncharacterized protein n=1 Tax=Bradyrhizobium canariense TaxID=255045 RepID=A0ABX3X7T0_9BRAD|nr:hypothetical protein BSR47_29560 [Bradyrhizobium canariense]OSJ32469.1 hypothetical protein BST63_07695 [Bradyrhizobium canariense]